MDMQFYWLVGRVSQKMFKVYWAPGSINLADFFSKKLPASHHRAVRPIYTYSDVNLRMSAPRIWPPRFEVEKLNVERKHTSPTYR